MIANYVIRLAVRRDLPGRPLGGSEASYWCEVNDETEEAEIIPLATSTNNKRWYEFWR